MKSRLMVWSLLAAIAMPSVAIAQNQQKEVKVLLEYLKVFPEDIGTFNDVPRQTIRHINEQGLYGYNDWRLPTDEELSLIRANRNNISGFSATSSYMTTSSEYGLVRLVTTGKTVALQQSERAEAQAKAEKATKEKAAAEEKERRQKQLEIEEPEVVIYKKYGKEVKVVRCAWSNRFQAGGIGYRLISDSEITPMRALLANLVKKKFGTSRQIVITMNSNVIRNTCTKISKNYYNCEMLFTHWDMRNGQLRKGDDYDGIAVEMTGSEEYCRRAGATRLGNKLALVGIYIK